MSPTHIYTYLHTYIYLEPQWVRNDRDLAMAISHVGVRWTEMKGAQPLTHGILKPQTTSVVEGMCAPRFPPPPAPWSGNISPCRAAQPGGGNLENRIPRGGRKASRRTGDHIRDTIWAPERRPSDERRVEARRGRPRGGRARGSFHQDVVTRTMDPIGVSRTGRAHTT